MPAPTFLTVPQELQTVAHACWASLQGRGYTLKAEYAEEHFPETATILAKRGQEYRFYIFDVRPKDARTALWASYGRSCRAATYITLCVPETAPMKAATIASIRQLGIGLTAISADDILQELVPPADLSLNVALPPLDRHRARVRRELEGIHEDFERDWKRGFERACKLVERHARKYLISEAKTNSFKVPLSSGNVKTLTPAQAEKMPLGALADAFCKRLSPKQVDSFLCSGLKRINPARVDVAHDKLTPAKERRLRQTVTHLMWTIDNLLVKVAS